MCDPSARLVNVTLVSGAGLVYAPPSSEREKLREAIGVRSSAPVQASVVVDIGSVSPSTGPRVIATVGSVRSTVKLCAAGVGSAFPALSTA